MPRRADAGAENSPTAASARRAKENEFVPHILPGAPRPGYGHADGSMLKEARLQE